MAASLPKHIAIIPDGNRRWAKALGKSTEEGHREGYAAFKRIADLAFARGVEIITFYAFSTENWKRTETEVKYLMKLLGWILTHEAKEYHAKGIKIVVLGDRERLSAGMVKSINAVQELTRNNTAGRVNICLNYGGRDDIVSAVRTLMRRGITPEEVTPEQIANSLSTANIPDPDLVIRTSGEHRLSNFLPWESTYSELYFTSVLWPDFDDSALNAALDEFALRQRRFGS